MLPTVITLLMLFIFLAFLPSFLFPRHSKRYKLFASIVAKKWEQILWNERLRSNGVFSRER